MANEETRAKLEADVLTGARAEQFFNSDFWTKDLRPIWEKDQEEALIGRRWSPAEIVDKKITVDQIALSVLYFSGVSASIAMMSKKMLDMVTRGREAQQEIERMEKKK